MLLSRMDGESFLQLVNCIRKIGHQLILIVTALGYNHSLNEKHYDDLAARIRLVYTSVIDPPPIVTINCSSQLLPFLNAFDPDLIISMNFPYKLTGPILAHRSMKINSHTSPLPLYRGSNAYGRAVLKQVPRWGVTWHYIDKNYDTGNILIQEFFELQLPYTIKDIAMRSRKLIFETLGEAVRMTLAGNAGTVQRQPTIEEESYVNANSFTIAERTISVGLSCHEVWTLVEACRHTLPALISIDQRLYQVIEVHRLETLLPDKLAVGEIKRKRNHFVQQCTDGQMEYVVRVV
jgi:methionyl-tRNA formyltransferase